jgi:uncharacterized protein YndB with AHSA1/START domain
VTEMGRSQTSPDLDSLISEVQIAAEPDRVFQALIDPQQVLQWWGQSGVYRCTAFDADLQVGGKWRSSGIGPDGNEFVVHGEFLAIDRPRHLAYTWTASWTGAAQTTVHWELEAKDHGTLLRIRHTGLAARPELAQSYRGWPRMLGWIQALLERGETASTRQPLQAAGD